MLSHPAKNVTPLKNTTLLPKIILRDKMGTDIEF